MEYVHLGTWVSLAPHGLGTCRVLLWGWGKPVSHLPKAQRGTSAWPTGPRSKQILVVAGVTRKSGRGVGASCG